MAVCIHTQPALCITQVVVAAVGNSEIVYVIAFDNYSKLTEFRG